MEQNDKKQIKIAIVAFLVIASLFLLARTVGAVKSWSYSGKGETASNIITVSGRGEAVAKPDIAAFTLTIIEEGKTVEEAQKKATDKTNAVLNYIKGQKIEEKDIKTTAYNINPKYEYRNVTCIRFPCPAQQNLVGYEVSQSVEIKVRDTAKAGTVLSGIGALEVQNVSGLDFRIDDEEKVKSEARQKAINDAKMKAKELADQLGVKIVRIAEFSETGSYPPIMFNQAREMKAMDSAAGSVANAPELPAGENEVVSNVTITYEIR